MVDVGTGDGLFVYRCAREDSQKFFIGIDANRRPLEKISERIHRRPAKGGLRNILFLQAAVEDLPSELDGIATEVHVQFPWGSLLRGVAARDEIVIGNLRRICSSKARLQITIGLDAERDRYEWERLKLSPISARHVESVLAARYHSAGFKIIEMEELSASDLPELQTSWAKRLQTSSQRSFIRIVAKAEEIPSSRKTSG